MITSEDLYTEEFEEVEAIVEQDDNAQEHEEGPGNASEAEEAPGTDPDAAKKTVKPKRVVRNPQPKLDAETLKGKKGLTALPSYFERVSFKGKGYEEQDLSVILKTYEYWCHRLFPKYPFDASIAKIEKLGIKKGPTQTLIKKIRLDMIYDHEPNLNDDTDSDADNVNANNFDDLFDDVPNMLETPIEPPPLTEITEEQQEQIRRNKKRAEQLRQERLRKAQEMSQSSLQPSSHFSDDLSQFSMESEVQSLPSQVDTPLSQTLPTIELNEELQERIRLNREKAEKLRQERLRRAQELGKSSASKENILEENSTQECQVSNTELENESSDEEQREEDVDAIFTKIQEQINGKTNSSNVPLTGENEEESGNEAQSTIEARPNVPQLEEMSEN